MKNIQNPGIELSLAVAERRTHHCHGSAHVRSEYVAVVHLEVHLRIRILQTRKHRSEQTEGITDYAGNHHSPCREHQHPPVILQSPSHIIRLHQKTVHPDIIRRSKEIWNVIVYKVGNLLYLRHIDSRRKICTPSERILFLNTPREMLYGFNGIIRVIRIAEKNIYPICA